MKNINKNKIILLLFFFCTARGDTGRNELWITVFVHGIMSIQPHLTLGNFFHFMMDSLDDTVYKESLIAVRKNPFFYKNQLMQQEGLIPIQVRDSGEFYNASEVLAYIYGEVAASVEPRQKNYFYTFGWSGLLSRSARYEAGKTLLQSLDALVAQFHENGFSPRLRIIGYSHGGNVCLNTAAAQMEYKTKTKLRIDEVILLGCPIQSETDFLVNDPLFKKIYNIYSLKDRIQVIDFFSLHRVFSNRVLTNRYNFDVDPKVTQINIKITKTIESLHHSKKELVSLTNDLTKPHIRAQNSAYLRDVSPGHMELWFLEWTPRNYRKDFLLRPFPLVVFLPYLLHHVQKCNYDQDAYLYPLTLDIRPEHKVVLLKRHRKNGGKYTTRPFIERASLRQWADAAYEVKPRSYTTGQFKEALAQGIVKAKETFYEDNRLLNTDLRLRRSSQKRP